MLKHTISISCCFDVAVVAFFLFCFFVLFFWYTKPRKKLELDLTQVNKTDKASFISWRFIANISKDRDHCAMSVSQNPCAWRKVQVHR